MNAISKLGAGQGLRLLVSFKPVPLFGVLQKQGYTHDEKPLDGGDWEIVFTPELSPGSAKATVAGVSANVKPGQDDASGWPEPGHTLDNRGMMPPEPMIITMEVVESMTPGEVLECFYDREPLLLYPELGSRGHLAHCEKIGANVYRALIRVGNGSAA